MTQSAELGSSTISCHFDTPDMQTKMRYDYGGIVVSKLLADGEPVWHLWEFTIMMFGLAGASMWGLKTRKQRQISETYGEMSLFKR